MIKLKFKPTFGGTTHKDDLNKQLNTRHEVIEEAVNNMPSVVESKVKEKKIKSPAKKVVYISKSGSKAIFDSIHLCAKIFGKNPSTIKYRIEHPKVRATTTDFDWLEGGKLEYIN